MNDGGAHHTAAAKYISARLGQRVPLDGTRYTYSLNALAVASLRRDFEIFVISDEDAHSAVAFFEAMRAFRATWLWHPLPRPYEGASSRHIDQAMRLHYHPGIRPGGSIMPTTLEAESTLTDRYQTTVPETVRRALRLGKRDKIHYTIQPTGEVVLTRADAGEDDPVLGKFLEFLARDIAEHPERLQPLTVGFVQRAQELAAGIEVDLDAPLSPEGE